MVNILDNPHGLVSTVIDNGYAKFVCVADK